MTNTTAFESIESAQEYIGLLVQVVEEAQKSFEENLRGEESSASPRRTDALRLVSYNLKRLGHHMGRSRRILNDLRTLRRLLHQERQLKAA